ncbi:MAG: carbohydrate porin [Gammaproteobacteria bacterium]
MFKNGLRKRAAIVGLVAWVTASGLAVGQSPADVIYAGGDGVTNNDKQPKAEAGAIKDGKLVAVDGESRQESGSTLQKRPTLFGNWGGVRGELAEHGIGVSAYLTQFYGGLTAGDGNRHFEYGGKADLLMNINGEKIGLWDGFTIIIHGEFNFDKNANSRGGVLIPTNTAMLLPNNNSAGGDLTNVSFVQRIGKRASLVFGKINMVDAYSAGSWYSGGAGITKFQNLQFVAPLSGITPPVILGAILSVKAETAAYTFAVYDPEYIVHRTGLDHPFREGVSFMGSVELKSNFGQMPGKHKFSANYSTQDGINLKDIPIIFLPPEAQVPLQSKDQRYFFSYGFEQSLVKGSKPGEGWGLFGQVSLSDANPNPFAGLVTVGIGGSSLIPGRGQDSFGVGLYYQSFSRHLKDGIRPVFDLGNEFGSEIFYNVAVTRWFRVTPNLQIADPGLRDRSTAVQFGLRAQIVF